MSSLLTSCYCHGITSINHSDGILRLFIREILFLEASDKYVKIYVQNIKEPYLIRATMTEIAKKLQPPFFCRVNRSYIINVHQYIKIDQGNIHMQGGHKVWMQQCKIP